MNKTDTNFIEIKHSGDFGLVTAVNCEFKRKLQTGSYFVFINDTLTKKAIFENGNKNGLVYDRYGNGEYSEMPYENGKLNGIGKYYFANGGLKSRTVFKDNQAIIRSFYNHDRKTVSNELFIEGKCVRYVLFDRDGHIRKIEKIRGIVDENGESVNEVLNGKKIYKYKKGTFVIFYTKSNISRWDWINSK